MNWTQEQYEDYMRRFMTEGQPMNAVIEKARKSRQVQPAAASMNKTEARYAGFLDVRKTVGDIEYWRFEAVTLKLADGVRFRPDFQVVAKGVPIAFHEVKVKWKTSKSNAPHMEDDARVKLMIAAREFPEFNFYVVWPGDRGEWNSFYIHK